MLNRMHQSKALMRQLYEELWNQRRLSVAKELFARPEGVERFIAQFLTSFPDLQHTVEDMIAEEDRIAARFTAQGTHTGPWVDFPATGVAIQYTGVTVARFAGDKIIEHYTWWDKAGLIEQIEAAVNSTR